MKRNNKPKFLKILFVILLIALISQQTIMDFSNVIEGYRDGYSTPSRISFYGKVLPMENIQLDNHGDSIVVENYRNKIRLNKSSIWKVSVFQNLMMMISFLLLIIGIIAVIKMFRFIDAVGNGEVFSAQNIKRIIAIGYLNIAISGGLWLFDLINPSFLK